MLIIYLFENNLFPKNIKNRLNFKFDNNKVFFYSKHIVFKLLNNVREFMNRTKYDFDLEIKELKSKYNLLDSYFEGLVISPHKSNHDFDMITIHFTGNFISNIFGGDKETLNTPNLNVFNKLKKILLENKNDLEKDKLYFNIEATHHGPTTSFPICFFEIGPNDKAYDNKKNIDNYIKILLFLCDNYNNLKLDSKKSFCLIGGEHYFNIKKINKIDEKIKTLTNNTYLWEHIMPKYIQQELIQNETKFIKIIKEMKNKTNCDLFVLNKKYLKTQGLVKEILKKEKIKFISI